MVERQHKHLLKTISEQAITSEKIDGINQGKAK
jgi:hypothetical protein